MMIPEIAFTLDRNNRCLACEDKDERIAVLTHALELACNAIDNFCETVSYPEYLPSWDKDYYIQQAEAERGEK